MTAPRILALLALLASTASTASAGVDPMVTTQWGQSGSFQQHTPTTAAGDPTYPGCTTVAAAQVLNFYRWQDTANSAVSYVLDNPVDGPDVVDGVLSLDLPTLTTDWDALAADPTGRRGDVSEFLYRVAVTLNAQFGDGAGSPATGKQLENAFRYQWGFNQVPRRQMSVIAKSAFGYSDAEWAARIQQELDAGRPVIHMAQQVGGDAGHAFVIDGYDDAGLVHVNWGWGGAHDGWFDPNTLEDPQGRQWSREPMIFVGLEPTVGHAASRTVPTEPAGYVWTGNGSLISRTSGTARGYGLTIDEASVPAGVDGSPAVFFQWEVDPRDGTQLQIDAAFARTATVRYGDWSGRTDDRVYTDVALPFVLDPAADGHQDLDGRYFVVAVLFDEAPAADGVVEASVVSGASPGASSQGVSGGLTVDGGVWGGNGSLIGLTSGTATGYGLTVDETRTGAGESVVFFQWEIDGRDGRVLTIDAEGGGQAELTVGVWNGVRADDVTITRTLPATLDPAAYGLDSSDGQYLVLKVELPESTTERWVEARVK